MTRPSSRAWHHNAGNSIDGLNATLAAVGSSETFADLFEDIVGLGPGRRLPRQRRARTGDATRCRPAERRPPTPRSSSTPTRTPHRAHRRGAPTTSSSGSGAGLTSSFDFDGADHSSPARSGSWIPTGTSPTPTAPGTNYGDNLDSASRSGDRHRQPVSRSPSSTTTRWSSAGTSDSSRSPTDGGQTWTSLPCTAPRRSTTRTRWPTSSPTCPDSPARATTLGHRHVGTAGAPVTVTCQLGAAAGPMLLAFRLMTDPAVEFDGWHVRNIKVDDVAVGTPGSLAGWDNERVLHDRRPDYGFSWSGSTAPSTGSAT